MALAKWNTTVNTSFQYSENDRVAAYPTATAYATTRSEHSYSSGRHQIDFQILSGNGFVGVVPTTFTGWSSAYIGQTTGSGCSYCRYNAQGYTFTNGARASEAAISDGQTVRMMLDFTAQTIEFMANNVACAKITMAQAGIAHQPLYIAAGVHSGAAFSVRLIAPDPTPIAAIPAVAVAPVTPSPSPSKAAPTPKRAAVPAAAAVSASPVVSKVLTKPNGFPVARFQSNLSEVRSCVSPVNILLMGVAGGGKSSFVNTCHTSLLPTERTRIVDEAYVHASKGHASTDLLKFRLPSTNVTLWDPWGWTATNYTSGQLSFMLEGNLSHGFKMNDTPTRGTLHYNPTPTINDMVHGVIIVLPMDEVKDNMDSKEWWSRLSTFRQTIHDRRLFGVIALTKCDVVDEKLSRDQSSIYDSNEVNRISGMIRDKIGFAMKDIKPVKLYHHETDRSTIVECLTTDVLADATLQAAKFYQSKQPASGFTQVPPSAAAAVTTTTTPTPAVPVPVPIAQALPLTLNLPSPSSSTEVKATPLRPGTSTNNGVSMSSATADERRALMMIAARGHAPTAEVLEYLRMFHGNIDAVVTNMNHLASL